MKILYLTSISKIFQAAFSFAIIIWIIKVAILIGIVAIITWVIKKIWKAGTEPPERKKNKVHNQRTEDWVYNANARQNNRYEYSDPVKEPKWTYNERARMWVDEEQLEDERHRQAYEENRRKWKAYEAAEAEREWAREQERQLERENEQVIEALHRERTSIILTEEEKELSKQIKRQRSGPTFEEWKAQQQKK